MTADIDQEGQSALRRVTLYIRMNQEKRYINRGLMIEYKGTIRKKYVEIKRCQNCNGLKFVMK